MKPICEADVCGCSLGGPVGVQETSFGFRINMYIYITTHKTVLSIPVRISGKIYNQNLWEAMEEAANIIISRM